MADVNNLDMDATNRWLDGASLDVDEEFRSIMAPFREQMRLDDIFTQAVPPDSKYEDGTEYYDQNSFFGSEKALERIKEYLRKEYAVAQLKNDSDRMKKVMDALIAINLRIERMQKPFNGGERMDGGK